MWVIWTQPVRQRTDFKTMGNRCETLIPESRDTFPPQVHTEEMDGAIRVHRGNRKLTIRPFPTVLPLTISSRAEAPPSGAV